MTNRTKHLNGIHNQTPEKIEKEEMANDQGKFMCNSDGGDSGIR